MTTRRSPLGLQRRGARSRIWRTALALSAAMACLVAGGVSAQTAQIASTGTLRVVALRIEFIPGAPPRATGTNPQLPQLPTTRFQRQHDQQYFRDVMSSVRSYFQEVSLGKLDVQTTLIGPVVAERDYDKDAAYYGDDGYEAARLPELVRRAISLSEGSVDFAQYDAIVVFQAGQGQESDFNDQNTSLILSRGLRTPFTASNKSFPGAVLQSAWEVPPSTGEALSIVGRACLGVMSVIGPGAMSTGSSRRSMPSDNAYVGFWDLMDRGWMLGPTLPRGLRPDWSSPAHPNPLVKQAMGWVTPIALANNLPNAQIPQVETSGTVYQLWKEGKIGQEYFLVENRQKTGYDGYLPDGGLLVWHINTAMPDQSDPQRLRVRLLQADGRQDIEGQSNSGDNADPFPGQLSISKVSDTTTPSTKDSTGSSTYVSITDIGSAAQVMQANLYIVPPMILSFRPGANFITESVTPTFRAIFSDTIDANSVKVTLDNVTVVDKSNLGRYYNTLTRELTYTSPQLAFAQHTINISVQNPAKTVSETTGDVAFRINFKTIPSGLRMVSVPYVLVPPENDPGVVFGVGSSRLAMARWNAAEGRYYTYPELQATLNPPADDATNPSRKVASAPAGLGYWVNLQTDSPTRVKGDQLESAAYAIPLFAGWNMIGNPFSFAVDWNGVQVEYKGVTKTLSEAVTLEWLSGSLYSYQTGGYQWVTAPAGLLQAWEAYWVKVKVRDAPVTLWVPPVESGIASLRTRAEADPWWSSRAEAGDGWRLRLSASAQSGAADTFNFIGAARSGRDGTDALDVEEPPRPGGPGVSLRIVEGGRSLAQDIRSRDLGNGKSWEFEVTTELVQQRIALSWPDLSRVPSGYEVRVTDLTTGREVFARTRGGYTYNSGDGGTRRFRLTVAPAHSAPIIISGLAMERTRGVPSVRFNLNREASVAVEVTDPSGRVISRLVSDRAASAGLNSVSTGRADGLGAGLYIVQVTATASDGAAARAVLPVVVTR